MGSVVFLFVSEPPDPPSIRLNSDFLPSKSDRVLTAGTNFSLSCHGNGSVHWTSTAFPLVYRGNLPDPVEVKRATPRHTGTYTCRYTNESLAHLNSWIHLYVTGKISSPPEVPLVSDIGFSLYF